MAIPVIVIPQPPTPPGWVPWPDNLPSCANSWSEVDNDPRVRSSMDAGRPKTRRRYTGIMRKVKVTMMLANNKDGGANEQAIALRTFYEGAGDGVANTGGCDGGYLYFKFVSPLDGVRHFYRFTKPPEITNTGPLNFISTMEWEEL